VSKDSQEWTQTVIVSSFAGRAVINRNRRYI